jgi:hypothetical protein
MPNYRIQIELAAKDAGAKAGIADVRRSLDGIQQSAQRATASLDQIDRAGRNMRIGLSSAAQAADLLGLNISGVVGPAAQAADAVGDMVGTIGTLGLAAGVIGGIVVAFGALNAVMQQRNSDIADTLLKEDEWFQSMRQLKDETGELTGKLNELAEAQARMQTGWSLVPADAITRLLLQNTTVVGTIAVLERLGIAVGDLTPGLETSAEAAARLRAELEQTAALDAQIRRWNDLNAAILNYIEHTTGAALVARRWEDYERGIATRLQMTQSQMNKSGQTLDEYNEKWDRLAKEGLANAEAAAARTRAALERLHGVIRGAVEQALTPTVVTAEDLAAAEMGTYVTKWDEWRRQLDAVRTGTVADERAWGAEFTSILQQVQQKTGLSLDAISEKYKDFSLFANKDLLKIPGLIDWSTIVGDTQQAIDSIIGKYNLVTEGVAQYLASPAAAAQLPQLKLALGLDADVSTAQVQGALTEALGGITQTSATGAAAQVKATVGLETSTALTAARGIQTAIANIPASVKGSVVKTIVDLQKSATWDAVHDSILSDLDMIPSEKTVTVTLIKETEEGGGGGGGAGSIPPPPGPPPQPPYNPLPSTGTSALRGGGITINVQSMVVRDEQDIRQLADELAWRLGSDTIHRAAQGF